MTLEELKQINIHAGVPDENLTDAKWQTKFAIMKTMVEQSAEKRISVRYETKLDSYGDKVFNGKTSYSDFCTYINSVLKTIRNAKYEHDYCYFIYQIATLLRFEHERLRTKYLPEYKCFEVWLEEA